MNKVKPVAKAVVAIVGAVVTAVLGTVTEQDWVTIVTAAVTAVGVYAVPNKPAV